MPDIDSIEARAAAHDRRREEEQQSQVTEIEFNSVLLPSGRHMVEVTDEDGNVLFSLPPAEQRYVVLGAGVRCTHMLGGISNSRIVQTSANEIVNGRRLISHKDTFFAPNLGKCRVRLMRNDRNRITNVPEPFCEPQIAGEQWQGYDETRWLFPGLFAVLVDDAYMICENGGMIYITEDGQIPASRNIDLLNLILAGRCFFCVFAGDPVNMATGNFIYEHIDLKIDGAVPLSFKRFYNIQTDYNGIFGRGWVHNYETKIIPDLYYGGVKILFEDGRQEFYWLDEDGKYISNDGIHSTLTRIKMHDFQPLESSGYLLEYPDNSCYQFDKDGKLMLQKNSYGNEIIFAYDKDLLIQVSSISGELNFIYEEMPLYKIVSGDKMEKEITGVNKLVAVKDHTGRKVCYEYEKYSHNTYVLSSYIDTKGEKLQYSYDYIQRLNQIINKDGICLVNSEFDINDRVVRQYSADGGKWIYEYDENSGDSVLTERNGSKTTYMRDHLNRTIGVKHPRGYEHFYYNDNNQKIKVSDKNNNKTNYIYDDKGNLVTECNALEVATEYDYTDDNKIESMTIAGQKKFHLEYDKNGDLSVARDALGNITTVEYIQKAVPENINLPDGSRIQLFYDRYRNITKIINAVGVATEYQYDTLHRVVKEIDGNGNETSFQYDTEGNITQIKNAVGDVQTYIYNNRGLLTQLIDFDGSSRKWEYEHLKKPTKIIDQLGRETKLSYNLMWHLEEVEEANGAKTKIEYDKECNIKSIEKPNGGKSQIEYDPNGNHTSVIDEDGHQIMFVYDALNQLTKIKDEKGAKISYTYNEDGQITSEKDALGNITYFTYDEAGQLIEKINPLSERCTYTYTSLGRIESVTDEAGRKTYYEYKQGGLLWKLHHPDGICESYDYDSNGNLKAHKDRLGNTNKYIYDPLNQVIRIEKLYNESSISKGEISSSKCFSYDSVGNITSMKDEAGNVTFYEYTLTGKLSKVIDPLGNRTLYSYDLCDRLVEVRQIGSEYTDNEASKMFDTDYEQVVKMNQDGAGFRVTKYHRDISGQIISIADALGQVEEYNYNKKGQIVEKLDKDGYRTKYDYTPYGDVSSIKYGDGREVEYLYDSLHRLNEVKDWLGTTSIKYDALGRTISLTNHNQQTIRYTWGTGNVRDSVIYPDGKEVKYQYDKFLRLQKVTNSEEVDYYYNDYGQLARKQYSNELFTLYEYDQAGKLSWFSHNTLNKTLDSYVFMYDILGNKVEIEKNRARLPEESKQEGRYSYKYDKLNRLKEVYCTGELIKSYSYDGYGNRTGLIEKGKEVNYIYNALNQLITVADSNENYQRYSYDKRGNQVESYKNNNLTHQYYFGSLDKLEKAINYEKQLGATYNYNGFGHRIGKMEGKFNNIDVMQSLGVSAEVFEQMRLNPVKEIEDVLDLTKQYKNLLQRKENQNITSYIWDYDILSLQGNEENFKRYLLDELGSPIRMLNDSNVITELYDYDEFGNDILFDKKIQEDNHQPFGYTGYQLCSISNSLYAQAREYLPTRGRFVSQDKHWDPENMIYGDNEAFTEVPNFLQNNIPDLLAVKQSNNSYGYAINNPLLYVDPTGLTCEVCDFLREEGSGIPKWTVDTAKEAIKYGVKYRADLAFKGGVWQVFNNNNIFGYNTMTNSQRVRAGLRYGGWVLMVAGGIMEFHKRIQEKETSTLEAGLMATGITASRAVGGWAGAKAGTAAGLYISAWTANIFVIGGVVIICTIAGAFLGGEIFEGTVDAIRNPTPRVEVDRTGWYRPSQ